MRSRGVFLVVQWDMENSSLPASEFAIEWTSHANPESKHWRWVDGHRRSADLTGKTHGNGPTVRRASYRGDDNAAVAEYDMLSNDMTPALLLYSCETHPLLQNMSFLCRLTRLASTPSTAVCVAFHSHFLSAWRMEVSPAKLLTLSMLVLFSSNAFEPTTLFQNDYNPT